MKKIIYLFITISSFAFLFNSCVDDNEYDTPQISCEEPVLTGTNVELSNIITLWENGTGVTTFAEDYPDYITVYVTSSDKTGNFYKELFVQDKPENPTAAVKLSIDMRSLYTKFEPGRKIYIYLKGLAIGKNQSGELMIAEVNGTSLGDYIRENVAKKNIVRSCQTVELMPLMLDSPLDANENYLGMYIGFDNMQFDANLLNENFVDPNDSFDTHYLMKSCVNNTTINLETSTYASFKNNQLPQNAGSVYGILTRDYGNDFNVLRVNDVDAFTFEGPRCDPEIIDCGLATSHGNNTLIDENFDSYLNGNTINQNGWTNFSEAGDEPWESYLDSYSNSMAARLNPYQNGSESVITWLISPAVDMDAQDGEVLSFETSNSFSDDSTLEVFISNDWDGTEANIVSATWASLPEATIVDDGEYYQNWVSSGLVDLSCAEGNCYIAFKYTGDGGDSSSTFNGTYELDNFLMTSD